MSGGNLSRVMSAALSAPPATPSSSVSATARGIEVLLLTDPVDAFWTSGQLDFGGKPLKSLSQGDIDFALIPLLLLLFPSGRLRSRRWWSGAGLGASGAVLMLGVLAARGVLRPAGELPVGPMRSAA